MRKTGTNRSGEPFGPLVIAQVWDKGSVIPGYAPSEWRCDSYGNYIFRKDYGDTGARYGWEIDHIRPVSAGGADDLENLQPLQWQNNRAKGDKYPYVAATAGKSA